MSQKEGLIEEHYIGDYNFMKKDVFKDNSVFGVSVFLVPLGGVTCSDVEGKIALSLHCQ